MLSIPLRYNQNLHLTIRKKFSFSETYSRSFMINEYWQLQHFHPQLMCSSNFLLLLKYFLSDLHLSSGFRLHATVDWFDFTVQSNLGIPTTCQVRSLQDILKLFLQQLVAFQDFNQTTGIRSHFTFPSAAIIMFPSFHIKSVIKTFTAYLTSTGRRALEN